MPNQSNHEPTRQRDGWVSFGMTVSATAAALSSFSGLYELALAAGWASLMAPLLPLTVDAFAATATRVWLAASTPSQRARRFARTCAVGAILLSLCGNAVWHLIAAGLLAANWVIVLSVGAVPPVVLGLVSHLAVLRTQDDRGRIEDVPAIASAETSPSKAVVVAKPSDEKPHYANENELLLAARQADLLHRNNSGKPISRDALRRELRIGGQRATELLRRLKAESSLPSKET